jgi:hypothetical protein
MQWHPSVKTAQPTIWTAAIFLLRLQARVSLTSVAFVVAFILLGGRCHDFILHAIKRSFA